MTRGHGRDGTVLHTGVPMLDLSPEAATRFVAGTARERRPVAVHLCNAYTLALAGQDRMLAEALRHKSGNLIDGTPVAWYASAATRRRSPGPVRGPDLLRNVLREPGLRHYFLGGSPRSLEGLLDVVRSQFPEAVVAGSLSPPFVNVSPTLVGAWAAAIRTAAPDVVWVGLGTPKQDLALRWLVDAVSCPVVGVGAAFDFLAGTATEAPSWMRGTGLEWMFRLATEPKRLWRRYLLGNTVFALASARQLPLERRRVLDAGGEHETTGS